MHHWIVLWKGASPGIFRNVIYWHYPFHAYTSTFFWVVNALWYEKVILYVSPITFQSTLKKACPEWEQFNWITSTESRGILLTSNCPEWIKEREKTVIVFTHYNWRLLSPPSPSSIQPSLGLIPWFSFGRSALLASQTLCLGESGIHPHFQRWMVTQVWPIKALHSFDQRLIHGWICDSVRPSEIQVDGSWGYWKTGNLRHSVEPENEANGAEARVERWRQNSFWWYHLSAWIKLWVIKCSLV